MSGLIPHRISLVAILFLISSAAYAYAGWDCRNDHALGVSTGTGDRWNVHVVHEPGNGALMVWQDRRGGVLDKLYTQRLDATGTALWQPGGIPLSASAGYQYYPAVLDDGAGGAYVVWQDNRTGIDYDIYAQHVSLDGQMAWGAAGIPVCTASGHQYNPRLISDGLGGIIVVWQDRRSGNFTIYGQHLDAGGNSLWPTNGSGLSTGGANQVDPSIAPDGNGGAIVSWTDYRDSANAPDIYAQHILSNGAVAWSTSGVVVGAGPRSQANSQVISDGSFGAIVSWDDQRSSGIDHVYAQRLDENGNALWASNGISICFSGGFQLNHHVVDDGNGGFVAVWQDNRSGSDYDIYAQRVDFSGNLLWSNGGAVVCSAQGYQINPSIDRENNSVLVAWQDKRDSLDYDIYAQRLYFAGPPLWPQNGRLVYRSAGDQIMPNAVGDGAEGMIVAWADLQNATGYANIFAQRVGSNGQIGGGCFRTLTQNDFSAASVPLRSRIHPSEPTGGNVRDTLFHRSAFPGGLPIGFVRKDSLKKYGWEMFSSTSGVRKALPQTGPSRGFDSIGTRKFLGALTNPILTKYNNALVGNLLALKLDLAASDLGILQPGFGDLLYNNPNNPADIFNMRSVRSIAPFLDSSLTYWRNDSGANYGQFDSTLQAIVGAYSGPIDTLSAKPLQLNATLALFSFPFLIPNPHPGSGPIAPTPIIPIDRADARGSIQIQNYPNPFNPTTTISFLLPAESEVSLRVYNVLGQEVAVLFDRALLSTGRQSARFDASTLASGVYFYNLTVDPVQPGSQTGVFVKKMLLMK
ncbi:MAG TPA: T9SS type A sorting domain-containing protein [Bacteroidota bacterium]|nr:T9SS type A sorting domain-containing protein [Bacteroidota bacterium]